jgi:uncharacterized protein YcbK (DUF882 family)
MSHYSEGNNRMSETDSMQLSEHFSLSEMTFSQTATRRGLDNTPSAPVVKNLKTLCEKVLEPLREKLGKPIHVTSGYRSEVVNAAVGGVSNSQHLLGEAADIVVPGMSVQELFNFVRNSGIEFDQLINEYGRWVHVSYTTRHPNRKSVLLKSRTGYKYA